MQQKRIAAIDIFRALTMFLMIFVNDFWTLSDIPEWLGHARASEDRMGLSDWVFPGFLFIVGLSIPFAIQARQKKGATKTQTLWHIVMRSFALIVMGFYMVNLENISSELLPFSKYIWQLLMALAIVLIWNIYPNQKAFGKIPEWVMQVAGILILVLLSIVYKRGTIDDPTWLKPHWWGILGIIGWAYLLCASLYLLIGERILYIGMLLLFFHALNVLDFIDLFGMPIHLNLMVSASNHVSILSGILTTLLYIKYGKHEQVRTFLGIILLIAFLSIIYGTLTRPEWGISKMKATPSWTSICVGISIILFSGIYVLSDLYGKTSWASILAPAGRSTLTCYLVPYFYYAIMMLVGIFLPEVLKTGILGIIKSLLFALLIISLTGLLERIHIRLKV